MCVLRVRVHSPSHTRWLLPLVCEPAFNNDSASQFGDVLLVAISLTNPVWYLSSRFATTISTRFHQFLDPARSFQRQGCVFRMVD